MFPLGLHRPSSSKERRLVPVLPLDRRRPDLQNSRVAYISDKVYQGLPVLPVRHRSGLAVFFFNQHSGSPRPCVLLFLVPWLLLADRAAASTLGRGMLNSCLASQCRLLNTVANGADSVNWLTSVHATSVTHEHLDCSNLVSSTAGFSRSSCPAQVSAAALDGAGAWATVLEHHLLPQ